MNKYIAWLAMGMIVVAISTSVSHADPPPPPQSEGERAETVIWLGVPNVHSYPDFAENDYAYKQVITWDYALDLNSGAFAALSNICESRNYQPDISAAPCGLPNGAADFFTQLVQQDGGQDQQTTIARIEISWLSPQGQLYSNDQVGLMTRRMLSYLTSHGVPLNRIVIVEHMRAADAILAERFASNAGDARDWSRTMIATITVGQISLGP